MTKRNAEPSLVEGVVTAVRRRIMTGEYPPGFRLRIPELAKASDVSIIPVREALRVLEGERLVHYEPNRGAVVAGLSIRDLNDLYKMRMQLEPLAVASQKPLTGEEAESLVALLDAMDKAREDNDAESVMDLHRRFHFTLYERAESTWLPHLTSILWNHAERYQFLSITPRNPAATSEHLAIVRSLEAGEADKAGAIMRDHLDATRAILEQQYADLDEADSWDTAGASR